MKFTKYVFILTFILLLAACAQPVAETAKPQVVATTNILGDVVDVIGGDKIELTVLFPWNADPHSFEPTPKDLAKIERADIVFINGLGLEETMEHTLLDVSANLIPVSNGVETIALENGNEHQGADPHVWMDPGNVAVWAENIAAALSDLDPANAETYRANADAYITELERLKVWISAQVDQVPPGQRILVTDHDNLGYFAAAYGFEIVGTVIPGASTLAEPSAQQLAEIEDTIRAYGVPAIFIGTTVNPNLAQRISKDTGVQLVALYTGSLSDASGPAPTYLEMMRHNVIAIVEALR
jgi:ABC-type Zn uptake system ZnuABC Zn-binding protein ZnuA